MVEYDRYIYSAPVNATVPPNWRGTARKQHVKSKIAVLVRCVHDPAVSQLGCCCLPCA